MARTKLAQEINEGYLKVARTVICPYCWELRAADNIHQFKPRVKCKPCYTNRKKGR